MTVKIINHFFRNVKIRLVLMRHSAKWTGQAMQHVGYALFSFSDWALHVLLAHMTHTIADHCYSQKERESIIFAFENLNKPEPDPS